MFEGDTVEGELEIGQVSSLIDSIETVDKIISDIVSEFNDVSNKLDGIKL